MFECIEAAYKYIVENTRWKAEIVGMERVETPEVPIEALREIIVNSFAHMRVNNSSFNEIYITPNRIHIYNPGFLVKDASPLDFASGKIGPVARNPLINTVLYLNKTIESFGTGFNRVFTACDKEKIKYTYGNNEFGFVFEFIRAQDAMINDRIKLTDTESSVLKLITTSYQIKKGEIASVLGKHETTVSRAIKKLVIYGLIERVGSKKTGYWQAK